MLGYKKRIIKAICAGVVACAILFVSLPQQGATSVSAASTLSELQERREELEDQKAENDKKLED